MATLIPSHWLKAVCSASFADYVKHFWDTVPGASPLVWNWHLDVLCSELQTVAERVFAGQPKLHDLIINISPGTSKSSIVSILFPTWVWTRMPEAKFITASHTDLLVLDLANKARQVVYSDLYRHCYPKIRIRTDQSAKGYYGNTAGGARVTCTVGGKSPLGFHGGFLIVDDPLDPKRAASEAELRAAGDFMTDTLPSRKVDKEKAVTILIMQRLHREDPTGVLLSRAKRENAGRVRHICLPAETAENVNPPELKDRYIDGLMDPQRLPRNVLNELRATLGDWAYSGQFMQSPISLEGGMFKEQWFNHRAKAAPYNAQRIRYWDRAASTAAGACYTAGVLMARDKAGNFYVEDVVHGQWEPDERNQRMRACALKDRARYGLEGEPTIWVEWEGGSAGRDAWKGIVRAMAGFTCREDRVTGKKEVRAEPWACQLAGGNVCIVDGDWDINGYIKEHVHFPQGKLKDQVDSSTGAFNLLIGSQRAQLPLRTYAFGGRKKGLRIILCTKEQLKNLALKQNCLLVFLDDELASHGLGKVATALNLPFDNLNPADYQEVWATEGCEKAKAMLKPEQGKQLWREILKQHDPPLEAIVIQDEGQDRGLSMACALSDVLGLKRHEAITMIEAEIKNDQEPPNKYIYSTVKKSRSLVI